MKSYNHLYEQFISDENIRLAIENSSRGKRDRKDVQPYLNITPDVIERVRKNAENFKTSHHKPIKIYDGISRKQREIIVPNYNEQIVHHMIVNVMKPIIMHGMYEHSYASIPGRGTHKGKKPGQKKAKEFIETWTRTDRKNTKYCLKMDVRKFFDSIPIDILKEKIRTRIHDERFVRVLYEVISVKERGLPLGFYTSQWFSNWYLEDLDHYIKEQLGATYYVRYMDDMIIFGANKRKLHAMREEIERFLNDRLGLELKGNYQVFRMDYIKKGEHHGRFLDFMGFRFYRDHTTLRRTIMLWATRKAAKIAKKEKPTIYDISQFMSYLGYIDCTDTYNMYLKWIKPYVDIKKCKRRKSAYDRRRKEKGSHGVADSRKRRATARRGFELVKQGQLCET